MRRSVTEMSSGRIARVLDWQRAGIPVLPIDTAAPVGPQVRHLLGSRGGAR